MRKTEQGLLYDENRIRSPKTPLSRKERDVPRQDRRREAAVPSSCWVRSRGLVSTSRSRCVGSVSKRVVVDLGIELSLGPIQRCELEPNISMFVYKVWSSKD